MIYGYIRVSSEKQTVENQRFEISRFCERNGLTVDAWIDETVSGTKHFGKRRLGGVMRRMREGDMLICSEVSRLGRSLYMVMQILNICMDKGCKVWTVKDGFRLGDDIQSKVLAFAFGLSAEIERQLISQRTKEALSRRRSEGHKLGRPKGAKTKPDRYKLSHARKRILQMYEQGYGPCQIARRYKVCYNTVKQFLIREGKVEAEVRGEGEAPCPLKGGEGS